MTTLPPSHPQQPIVPPDMWPEFNAVLTPASWCKREVVGTAPRGIRWSLWPLCFEQYVSDTEPDLLASQMGNLAYNRVIMWKRVTRTDIPVHWHQFSKTPWRLDGTYSLKNAQDYTQTWSKHARYDLRQWRTIAQERGYTIEKISMEEYAAAYKHSTVKKKVGTDLLRELTEKYTSPVSQPHTVLWGARNKSGDIIAGTAAIFSPTHQASVYTCPFVLPEGKETHAMFGLVDTWFAEAVERKVQTLWFTEFWQPGKPKSWKGSSKFKSHFGVAYVAYPPTLFRFVRGKFL